MEPNKFGVVYFLDGHVEDILRYKEYTGFNDDEEYIDFKTQSGEYVYISDVEVFSNGYKYKLRQFRDSKTGKLADIRDIVIIRYDQKAAGVVIKKSS